MGSGLRVTPGVYRYEDRQERHELADRRQDRDAAEAMFVGGAADCRAVRTGRHGTRYPGIPARDAGAGMPWAVTSRGGASAWLVPSQRGLPGEGAVLLDQGRAFVVPVTGVPG